jgi:hypothetical protein
VQLEEPKKVRVGQGVENDLRQTVIQAVRKMAREGRWSESSSGHKTLTKPLIGKQRKSREYAGREGVQVMEISGYVSTSTGSFPG